MTMQKFWLVWCVDGSNPTHQHSTRDLACKEAERLARANPGRRFEVMERVASVRKVDVIWEHDQLLEIPF